MLLRLPSDNVHHSRSFLLFSGGDWCEGVLLYVVDNQSEALRFVLSPRATRALRMTSLRSNGLVALDLAKAAEAALFVKLHSAESCEIYSKRSCLLGKYHGYRALLPSAMV